MARQETNISHRIMLDLAPLGVVLWKNVRGLFLTLDGRTKIAAGLQREGSSDLIGFTRVKITQEMVGQTVAVFTAIESKTATGGNGRPEQRDFIASIQRSGGIAGIARDAQEAVKIIQQRELKL